MGVRKADIRRNDTGEGKARRGRWRSRRQHISAKPGPTECVGGSNAMAQ